MQKPQVLVIVGPTASGKSDLGVRLAKKFDGEIISADSRQVYRGLDIGTGKVTRDEMQGIPHHLLDIADPQEQFSVSQYQKLGEKVLKDIVERGKLPIIVGGTGLYVDALSCAINFPSVPPNPSLRKELGEKNLEELLETLDAKDPIRAEEVDRKNKLRIIRALEIIKVLGQVPKMNPEDSAYEFIYIGLRPDIETLEKRIEKRLEQRLEGIIKECQKLLDDGLSPERLHDLGLEYRYVGMYLEGKITLEEASKNIVLTSRQYAKRQMTWFKRNENIKWFKPEDYEEIEKYANMALFEGD